MRRCPMPVTLMGMGMHVRGLRIYWRRGVILRGWRSKIVFDALYAVTSVYAHLKRRSCFELWIFLSLIMDCRGVVYFFEQRF